jgi:hypothetical protein
MCGFPSGGAAGDFGDRRESVLLQQARQLELLQDQATTYTRDDPLSMTTFAETPGELLLSHPNRDQCIKDLKAEMFGWSLLARLQRASHFGGSVLSCFMNAFACGRSGLNSRTRLM